MVCPVSVLSRYHFKSFEITPPLSYSKLHIQQHADEMHKLIFKINIFIDVTASRVSVLKPHEAMPGVRVSLCAYACVFKIWILS